MVTPRGILWTSTLALGAVCTLISTAGADSKSLKSKDKNKSEIYSALETEPVTLGEPQEIITGPSLEAPLSSDELDSAAQARALEERLRALEYRSGLRPEVPTPKTQAAAKTGPAAEADFERVPADKVQMITSRLKIVEQILMESGRAYDYRSKTTRELQGILDALRARKEAVPASAKILAE